MQLDPAKFNVLLNNLGQSFGMRRASACPCLEIETNAPKPNCPQCKGIGWLWGASVTGTSGIASQKIQREWANFGLWQSGDVVLTIPSDSPLYVMGPYDRVVMLDSTEAFSFVRRRGIDDTQPVPWASIERVFWLDEDEAQVVSTLPVISGLGLVWGDPEVDETIPAPGQQYSITGRKHPEFYMLQELVQDRAHHHGRDLPRRVVLRKLDLLGRRDA